MGAGTGTTGSGTAGSGLLRPLSADEVVPAGGGTLSVFFTATGPETTPQACAFDGISCG